MTLKIDFTNTKAISTNIGEPDILVVNFTDPGLFIDAETGDPMEKVSFEKRIKIGA